MGTIADKLNKILSTKEAIKQAIISKGVSVSDTDTFASYADKIGAITTGGNSTKYGATIDTFLGDVDENGVLKNPTEEVNLAFDGVVKVSDHALYYKFQGNELIKTVSFPDLTSIDNSGLAYCFYGCTSLTTAPTFANLTSIGSSGLFCCFRYAKITSLSFPALKSTSFGFYTTPFNNMLSSVTGCTVHFPSNLESIIGSWSSVTSGFGGTNTTVLFDLPATE